MKIQFDTFISFKLSLTALFASAEADLSSLLCLCRHGMKKFSLVDAEKVVVEYRYSGASLASMDMYSALHWNVAFACVTIYMKIDKSIITGVQC